MCRFIILLFVFASTDALACFPVKIPLEKRLANAQAVYVGFVTGIHHYQFEALAKTDEQSNAVIPGPYTLRVLVKKVIKGNNKAAIINPKILNCGSGKARIKDKVVVFFDSGSWYTIKFDDKTHAALFNAKH